MSRRMFIPVGIPTGAQVVRNTGPPKSVSKSNVEVFWLRDGFKIPLKTVIVPQTT